MKRIASLLLDVIVYAVCLLGVVAITQGWIN